VNSISSIGSARIPLARLCTRRLDPARVVSVPCVGQLVCLARSVRVLASPGDGLMSLSPTVMNSMCVCVYI
jgi:hypothetical protein